MSSFDSPIAGVILGFVLAKIGDLWRWLKRPNISIEYIAMIDDNSIQLEDGNWTHQRVFGVKIQNTGKTVANDVKVAISDWRLEDCGRISSNWIPNPTQLALYGRKETVNVTILPGRSATFKLAVWVRYPGDPIKPAVIIDLPHYYHWGPNSTARVEVVAWDTSNKAVSKTGRLSVA